MFLIFFESYVSSLFRQFYYLDLRSYSEFHLQKNCRNSLIDFDLSTLHVVDYYKISKNINNINNPFFTWKL